MIATQTIFVMAMNLARAPLLACLLLLIPSWGRAQAIDSVFVEVFNVRQSEIAGEPDLVTYRIFVDLAEGYELQMVYGDLKHSMRIETTTYFHNDPTHVVKYADRIDATQLSDPEVALDSWLTIGTIGDRFMGAPKKLDSDGSILDCQPLTVMDPSSNTPHATLRSPLCPVDGMIEVPAVKEVVNFKHEPGYLGKSMGSLVETSDGAWAVLGGAKGVTEQNILLIAQLSTTGTLSFKLNMQLETPDHQIVRYVASDPNESEIYFEGLTHGYRPR